MGRGVEPCAPQCACSLIECYWRNRGLQVPAILASYAKYSRDSSTAKSLTTESTSRAPLFHFKLESTVASDDVTSCSIRWQSCLPKARDHKKPADTKPTDIKYTSAAPVGAFTLILK